MNKYEENIMKIYIAHSRSFDYQNELYTPIRNNKELNEHEVILPHEFSNNSSNSRDFYKDIDLFIAECSYPATGLGIELGWTFDDNTQIYCIHKEGTKVSDSVYAVTRNVIEYKDTKDMLNCIENTITNNDVKRKK